MAWKASGASLGEEYDKNNQAIWQLRNTLVSRNAEMASGNVSADTILGIYRRLRSEHARITEVAAIPGMVQFAKDQNNDPNYDIVAEGQTLLGLIDTAADWIVTNMPTVDVNGTDYLVLLTLAAEADDVTWRTFTPAQTATLRTYLTAIINGIS